MPKIQLLIKKKQWA